MGSVLSLGLYVLLFSRMPGSDDVGENYTTFTGETISDFLQNNADYSDFRKL